MIHLEGMGILGCYIGLRLEQQGVDFTWHDTDERVAAWRACTGAIFPTGHAEDLMALERWQIHRHDPGFREHLEEADYIFSTKAPPHGGRYSFEPLGHGVSRAVGATSLHLAGPEWVAATRYRFRHQRLPGVPPSGARVVVTHGFGPRLARFMWGWTVPVKVRTLRSHPGELRPCLYFRRGRFQMAYAYPIPGTELWYAGSSLISQRDPKPLDVEKHFKRWRGMFMDLGGGYVTGVARAGQPRQGWRPVAAEGDDAWVREIDGRLHVRPLWHSGVRWAPLVWESLQKEL